MNTTQAGFTEPVRLDHCRTCGHPTLRAHADGVDIRCDPQPTNPTTELTALLTGRRSYQLINFQDGHLELAWRSPTRIRSPRQHTVVLTHQCARTITRAEARRLPDAVILTTRQAVTAVAGARPPF